MGKLCKRSIDEVYIEGSLETFIDRNDKGVVGFAGGERKSVVSNRNDAIIAGNDGYAIGTNFNLCLGRIRSTLQCNIIGGGCIIGQGELMVFAIAKDIILAVNPNACAGCFYDFNVDSSFNSFKLIVDSGCGKNGFVVGCGDICRNEINSTVGFDFDIGVIRCPRVNLVRGCTGCRILCVKLCLTCICNEHINGIANLLVKVAAVVA